MRRKSAIVPQSGAHENPRRDGRTIGDNYYPLRDQIRDELRAQIGDGHLPPGQRLIEQVLADQFGVSRIPVREALRSLESEGLVTMVPRRGMVVAELSRVDIEQLYEVRSALEILASSLAAQRASVSEVEALSGVLSAARKAVSIGDFREAVRLNAEFHDSVVRMAANPFLASALEPLTGRIRWIIGHGQEHERDLAEHAGLLAAIAAGDGKLAAERARSHMEASRAHSLRDYERQSLEGAQIRGPESAPGGA
jgi:DNA-binding GntR family transcriptional regulator